MANNKNRILLSLIVVLGVLGSAHLATADDSYFSISIGTRGSGFGFSYVNDDYWWWDDYWGDYYIVYYTCCDHWHYCNCREYRPWYYYHRFGWYRPYWWYQKVYWSRYGHYRSHRYSSSLWFNWCWHRDWEHKSRYRRPRRHDRDRSREIYVPPRRETTSEVARMPGRPERSDRDSVKRPVHIPRPELPKDWTDEIRDKDREVKMPFQNVAPPEEGSSRIYREPRLHQAPSSRYSEPRSREPRLPGPRSPEPIRIDRDRSRPEEPSRPSTPMRVITNPSRPKQRTQETRPEPDNHTRTRKIDRDSWISTPNSPSPPFRTVERKVIAPSRPSVDPPKSPSRSIGIRTEQPKPSKPQREVDVRPSVPRPNTRKRTIETRPVVPAPRTKSIRPIGLPPVSVPTPSRSSRSISAPSNDNVPNRPTGSSSRSVSPPSRGAKARSR